MPKNSKPTKAPPNRPKLTSGPLKPVPATPTPTSRPAMPTTRTPNLDPAAFPADHPHAAVRSTLLHKRNDLHALYVKDVRVGQESSDEGTEDIVDRANNAYNRELMFALSDSERQLMMQVDEALVRLEQDLFGICANCGREIMPARLAAIPWARYCIDCQELDEKGMLVD